MVFTETVTYVATQGKTIFNQFKMILSANVKHLLLSITACVDVGLISMGGRQIGQQAVGWYIRM